MAEFEKRLDASISEAQERGRLSNELYQKYLQFVGALEALPQDQISVDKAGTDIHDVHGRIKPFSQWPTKSGRARSEKVWLNYNQRLQLAQAAKEGGTAPEDPTDDPDFLGQFLDTCVRTSMRTGLDKNTAFRHCSRQVKRFEEAIRGALADRGLTKKQVEEFTQELLKGMANGKTIDMKDLSVEDRQFIQDLKDSLTYKAKNEGLIREDLDDKDEFRSCSYCDNIFQYSPELTPEDQEAFHTDHMDARNTPDFTKRMEELGWVSWVSTLPRGANHDLPSGSAYHWVRKPLKEDLDDKDDFTKERCVYCDGAAERSRYYPPTPLHINSFHDAHTEAQQAADQANANLFKAHEEHKLSQEEYHDLLDGVQEKKAYDAIMANHGFTRDKRNAWIKEDLDDRDQFGQPCNYYNCENRHDAEEFHKAHTTAHDMARKGPAVGKFSDAMQREMAKFGYRLVNTGKPVVGGTPFDDRDWTKTSIKEDVEAAAPRPTPTIILPNMKTLAKGDWIEIGPPAKLPSSGEGLDDQDEFSRDRDLPITPVQIVDISEVPSYRRDPKFTAPLRVRINNFNLLSLPDASGVRWHGRPKHHEPAWYEPWHGSYSDWDLETMFSDGELRIIDNIEQWYQSQPEK